MNRIKHRVVWLIAGILAVNGLLFGLTDATKVPSFVIIIGFLVLAITIWAFWYAFFSLLSIYGIHLQRKVRLSLYMSALVGGVLALQSIGELSRRDIVVLLPLIVLGYLYSAYTKVDRRNFDG